MAQAARPLRKSSMPWESRCSASVRHPRLHFGSCSSATPRPVRSSAYTNSFFMVAFYHITKVGRLIQASNTSRASGNPVHHCKKRRECSGTRPDGIRRIRQEQAGKTLHAVASPKCLVRIFQQPKSVLVLPSGNFIPDITCTCPFGSMIATGNSNL